MKREFTYEIRIYFETKLNNATYLNRGIPYSGSKSSHDLLIISENGITIVCKRSSKTELEEIFFNYNSSIYNQILKSILYCFALDFECQKIIKINIDLKNNKEELIDNLILQGVEINQPLEKRIVTDMTFNSVNLEQLFEETPKGKTILIAISSWLKASSSDNLSHSFEKYWIGFNALYTHIHSFLVLSNVVNGVSAVANEKNKLISTRSFLLSNPNILQYSRIIASSYDKITLRKQFRWYKMAKSEFDTHAKTREFAGFLTRYNDSRIMSVFDDILPFRVDILTSMGIYQNIAHHISSNLQSNAIDHVEVVLLMCFKYIYYVRNKDFHGEKIDPSYRLVENKETKEYEELNKFLSSLVVDLINGSNNY